LSTKWTAQDIPDQSGRLAVVTGASLTSDGSTLA